MKYGSHKILTSIALYMVSTVYCADDSKNANIYNPSGKRDPFKVLFSGVATRNPTSIYPTEKYDLDQLTLKAIIRLGGKSRAMVEAPDGQMFVLIEGETVGRERAMLSRILKTEIIFSQKTVNYLGNTSLIERVLSLPADKVGTALELGEDNDEEKDTSKRRPNTKARMKSKQVEPTEDSNKTLPMGTNEAIQKIMNRPNELEKQFDELIGGK
jgi:hypothetical protein